MASTSHVPSEENLFIFNGLYSVIFQERGFVITTTAKPSIPINDFKSIHIK
jgi:hypothetical protein